MNSRATVGKNSGGTCEKPGLSSKCNRKLLKMSVREKVSGLACSNLPLGKTGKRQAEKRS